MPKRQKSEEIKVRVTTEMKAAVLDLATARGEAESLIVREALTEYLTSRHSGPTNPTNAKKKQKD